VSTGLELNHTRDPSGGRDHLTGFYWMGAWAGVSLLVVILMSGAAYLLWPYLPGSAPTPDILQQIHDDPLRGFFGLDGLLVLGDLIGMLLFVALYASLREVHAALALLALVLGMVAVVLIFPARPISELFLLSERFVAATTDETRLRFLAAAEATLSQFDGTAFMASTFLGALSLLLSSLLMLRSRLFGRPAAYVGIVTNLAVCGFIIPRIGIALLFLSVPGYMIWNSQLAWRFSRLARQRRNSAGVDNGRTVN
jgi:hypothetical protein